MERKKWVGSYLVACMLIHTKAVLCEGRKRDPPLDLQPILAIIVESVSWVTDLTACGEWIPDGGAWQFQRYDENGLLRSLNGRLTGVHKVLCSAAEIACKGRQDFYLGHDGDSTIQIHRKIVNENSF